MGADSEIEKLKQKLAQARNDVLLAETRYELEQACGELEEAKKDLAAYKKAKEEYKKAFLENDDRFMVEREHLMAERDQARGDMVKLQDLLWSVAQAIWGNEFRSTDVAKWRASERGDALIQIAHLLHAYRPEEEK